MQLRVCHVRRLLSKYSCALFVQYFFWSQFRNGVHHCKVKTAAYATSTCPRRSAKRSIKLHYFRKINDQVCRLLSLHLQRKLPGKHYSYWWWALCQLMLRAIDCMYVQLRVPATQPFFNVTRERVRSVHIQVVCDANRLVTRVYDTNPGFSHDAFILASLVIPTVFQADTSFDRWLLGNNNYLLETWLLTPYLVPTSKMQHVFNRALSWGTYVLKQTYWMCFRCLDKTGGTLQYSPQKFSEFFVACCVLHNIAVRSRHHMDLKVDTLRDLRCREAELAIPGDVG